MPKQIILSLGLLIAVTGPVSGQDAAVPPMSSETAVLNDLFDASSSQDNWWINAEYLFGWIEGAHLPPLVTTSPTGTDQSIAGVLDDGNPTSILLGGNLNRNVQSGFRIGGGYIYDQVYGHGIEASFRFLPGQSSSFLFSSDDNAILARPYTDATNGDPASVLVAFPGNSTGTITVEAKSDSFYDANFDLSERIWETNGGLRLDTLFGYRFASFSDSLRIAHRIDSLTMPGTSIDTVDDFGAKNTFHGLDLGLRANYAVSDRLSLDLLTKLAVGNIHRTVNIRGQQITRVTGDPDVVADAGMLALSSNSGEHRRNNWTVLPEIGANLGWMFRSNMRLRLGYSALYLTDIARADNQIDSTVNPDLFPPADPAADPLRPEFKVRASNIWVQTLNIGLDVTF